MMTTKEEYDRRKVDQQATAAKKHSESFFVRLKDPLTAFTAILAAATLMLGWLGCLQWRTLEKSDLTLKGTLQAGTRAWVVPTGAHFDGDPKVGFNQRVKIDYENVGKEAASDVVVLTAWGPPFPVTIDDRQMPYIDVGQTKLWPNSNICAVDPSLYPKRAVYPSAKNEFITYGFNDAPYFPQEVFDGKKFFTIFGCIQYRSPVTQERVHHSPFCLYLQPKRGEPIQNWTFEFCPSGSANAD